MTRVKVRSGRWPQDDDAGLPAMQKALEATTPDWDWSSSGDYVVVRLYDEDGEERVLAKVIKRRVIR